MDRRSDILRGRDALHGFQPSAAGGRIGGPTLGSDGENSPLVFGCLKNQLLPITEGGAVPQTEPRPVPAGEVARARPAGSETLGVRILRLAEVAAALHLGQGIPQEPSGENPS